MTDKATWEGWMITAASVDEVFRWHKVLSGSVLVQGVFAICNSPTPFLLPSKKVRVTVEVIE